MRYQDSVFGRLMKPISRRQFAATVERHAGDACDKSFRSWDHLLALIFAQLSGIDGLRGLAAVWNANAHHHYHLGSKPLKRSTLADANTRRPVAIFADTFERLSALADRSLRRDGGAMLRIIDATPIPLGGLVGWADWHGPTRGLKLYVVYDPAADRPTRLEAVQGDGFTVLGDAEIALATQGRAKLAMPLRRISVRCANGGIFTIITNDLRRSALEVAALYKMRWQIEVLFRWIKQHLKLKKFLTRSENGIRLQLIAAIIAYLLLRLAARENRLALPAIRFAPLVGECLFVRKSLAKIERPPEVHPSKPRRSPITNQLELTYA